jgi:formate hydrogenlyase subunit 3/multisubunit Na+/H+ antiporter MnhD subunit
VLGALAGVSVSWGALLIGIGALNILAGSLLALRQTHVGRLLAYSSLSHLGYIVLGLGIGVSSGQSAGAQGGLFHMLTHGVMSGLAFLAAGALLFALHGAAPGHDALTVADLSGAARRYPLAALALSLAALGLAGLPPLAGFMSKWQIFVAGFATRDPAIAALVVFAALNSVLSLAYYAPLVNAVYRAQPSPAVRDGRAMPLAMRAPLGLLALAVVLLGVWPALAQPLAGTAGAAVLAAFGH